MHGFWGRDDFMQLAFVRLIGSPLPLFVKDHYFPGPGMFFRPMGIASFWLWHALFGMNYFAHAFADMLLHVAVGIALMRTMRARGVDKATALLCTLLFALHPVGLGTALWWSARFDLLAALFGLISLRAAFDYADRLRRADLILTLLAALAALLSKEIALGFVAAITLVWLRWAFTVAPRRAVALRALGMLWAIAAIFFAWRWAVLGTPTSGLLGDDSLPAAFAKGIADWARYLSGYLSFWPRLDSLQRTMEVLVTVLVSTIIVISFAAPHRRAWPSQYTDLLICALCLLLLPAILQAPSVALNAAPLLDAASAVEVAMQSRLYYMSFAGFFLLLSIFVARVWRENSWAMRASVVASLGVGVAMLGWVSRDAATAYAKVSSATIGVANAVVAAVERAPLPSTRCHVVLLGIPRPLEWSAYVSMDSLAKALSPDLRRIARCFIHSDQVTYFNLMGLGAALEDAAPYRPRQTGGNPREWLHIGDAVVAYVDPPRQATAATLAATVFLRYENGIFRDVTTDVAEGRLEIVLQ